MTSRLSPPNDIYHKRVMARCYGYASPRVFWRKVHANARCMEMLRAVGYNRQCHTLTPRQYVIVCECYGYPMTPEELRNYD